MIDTKSRILAICGALVLLLVVVDLVRRRKLKEEYSVLWVGAALGLLILAAWYQLLGWITTAIGGVALSTTLFFFALLFVFFVLLHYSVRISSLERRLTALVQESALTQVKAPPKPLAGGSGPARARIAVIIPCYDDGALVPEAIASVQEDEPIEIVVVDDGSTDAATLATLAQLERDGTTVVRRPNGGLGAARTTGLEHSHAELVYPLDADDRLEPGALAALADALEADHDAAFAWGDYVLFGAGKGHYRSPDRWLPWTLTYVNPYPVCSMFRRSTLVDAGGWQGWAYEDWDLWLRLVGMGRGGIRVPQVVYHRRLHDDPRLLTDARKRHQELYAEIVRRNAAVFARRDELRGQERPAGWKRLAYPILFGARKVVPISVEAFLQRTMMRLGTGLPG
ncbi:DUF2304 family protein [Baekduia sp. Peel2402]|uniref:DUF2304 family protein n=1 Tax=Baekduia sp. Peel2402 TaxID=3458296 RepID=UPI00403EDE61